MPEHRFKVTGRSESAARLAVKVRQFQLTVDEPPDLGGEDRGPNPVEFVLTGLVGCLNVMAHLIAQEMQLPLRSLEIEASGTLNPDRLFGKSTTDRAGFKHIEVVLRADSDADTATLDRWLETIRSRCPVSDNLTHPTPVDIRVRRKEPTAAAGR